MVSYEKIRKKGLIFITIFSILFLGGIGFGIFSVRNIFILALLIVILCHTKDIKVDTCQKLYIAYIAVLIITNIINGQFFEYSFIQNLFTYHIASIIIFLSIPIITTSYKKLNNTITIISIIYVFNCIVSILQFYNNPIGWEIGYAINPNIKNYEEVQDFINDGNFLSRSIVSGITGFVVANGYFSATILPIASRELTPYKKFQKSTIVSFCFIIVGGITIFMIQQRMAFAIYIFYLVLILLINLKKTSKMLPLIILVLMALYTFEINIPQIDMGRLTTEKIGSDARMNQITNFANFFNSDYFLFGVDLTDEKIGNSLGHNTLLDSLRRGGFFAFIVYLLVFISIAIKCIKIAYRAASEKANTTLALSLSCILYLLYSFTHSTGIQSGSVNFWLIYSLMIISIKYKNEKNNMPY